jgi:Cu/Ag efflux protein CusF
MTEQHVPRALAISVVAVLAALCVQSQPTADAAQAAGSMQVAAAQRFSVSGVVAAVDYASNTVTVRSQGQDIVIFVTPTTVIEQHGETGSISDIRKGVKISASGLVNDGRKTALSITLK